MLLETLKFLGLFLVATSVGAERNEFLMGPYVNYVTPHSARILWVAGPKAALGRVICSSGEFRREVEASTAGFTGRDEQLHVAVFEDLDHSTLYHYEVRGGRTIRRGTFHTAPPRGARDTPFRFIVYGDTRTYPERHLSVSRAMAKEEQVWFVVLSGDLVSNGDKWNQWEEQFFTPAQAFLKRTAFWPVRGNHEGSGVLYRQLFDLPGNELWYSFDYGNLHYVILDSEAGAEEREGMIQWLEGDLAENDADWTFVSYHKPTYNIGGHASKWGAEDVLPILEKHEVDVVITGHSHLYERFKPIGPEGKKPVIHIVSGGGGAPSYEVRPSSLLEGGIGYSGLHYCYFQIDGSTLRMTVKKPDGSVLDRMKLVKKSGKYQKKVMRKTSDAVVARMAAHMLQGVAADFRETPSAGSWSWVSLPLKGFPPDTKVGVASHPKTKGWRVDEDKIERTDEGVRFRVKVPDNLKMSGDKLEPPFRVVFRLTHHGRVSEAATGPLSLAEASLRRMLPAPEPVEVGRAPGRVVIDADISEWDKIHPLPKKDGSPSSFRFSWDANGLYGLALLEDAEIVPDPKAPWRADSVHLFVEKDFKRSLKEEKNPNASIIIFSPGTEGEQGAAAVVCWEAGKEKKPAISVLWKKTDRGYLMEFHLPADMLAPARMEGGTVMGFNFAHGDNGNIKECFQSEWEWHSPFCWGAIRLTE